MASWHDQVEKIDDYRWKIPQTAKPCMNVPGLIYADQEMMEHIFADNAQSQVMNVACLPGIVKYSLAMPDIHFGYGFAVGAVAAFDPEKGGIISPGGVGYDINCGVRSVRTNLTRSEVTPLLEKIANQLARDIPSGVGSEGPLSLSGDQLDQVLVKGSRWAKEHGYANDKDIQHTEESGSIAGADPSKVSRKAKERGKDQLGTLGSGNHFLEVEYVEEVYDEKTANAFGLRRDQVTVMIHSGSRGLGHQVATDYIGSFAQAVRKYGIELPDRQLVCAPVNSEEGKDYYAAMAAAANFAWANRQLLMHWMRQAMAKATGRSLPDLGIELVFDVAHNVAKMMEFEIEGRKKTLCVHRKGATIALPPGHPGISEDYRSVGQPVPIPGDMGRCSYLLVGTPRAMEETFGLVCHGAGRKMSRSAAMRKFTARDLLSQLESQGIIVRAASKKGIVEEAPEAYKDVREVVHILEKAGIARPIVRFRPMAVVKG